MRRLPRVVAVIVLVALPAGCGGDDEQRAAADSVTTTAATAPPAAAPSTSASAPPSAIPPATASPPAREPVHDGEPSTSPSPSTSPTPPADRDPACGVHEDQPVHEDEPAGEDEPAPVPEPSDRARPHQQLPDQGGLPAAGRRPAAHRHRGARLPDHLQRPARRRVHRVLQERVARHTRRDAAAQEREAHERRRRRAPRGDQHRLGRPAGFRRAHACPRLSCDVEHDPAARAAAAGGLCIARRRLPPRMAERQLHGLQRVLGVNALFSTAYGNVGSSIYYALGLVAALAAGLTPLVFLITGALFYCTATTYAEATAMYPEAGGSSLFARRAFNELWSFFTAWAQMLNYIITIAISAFFAAHYAGRFMWDGFKESPGDIGFAGATVALLALVNVRGVKDAVSVNLVLAVIDFLSQLAIVGSRRLPRLQPPDPRRQPVVLRRDADADAVPARHPDRHRRLHRHRDDLQHGRGGARPRHVDSGRDPPRHDRRLRDLLHAAADRAVGAAGGVRRRRLPDAAGRRPGGRRLRQRPDHRRRLGHGSRLVSGRRGGVCRRARRDDPHRRHERGRPGRLAVDLLDGDVPPAPRHDAPAASALPHPVPRDPRLLGVRDHRAAARPGRLPGQDLRVRGDAVVLDGAPVADLPARDRARRAAPLPQPGPPARPRPRAAAAGGDRAHRDDPLVHRRQRRSTSPSAPPA